MKHCICLKIEESGIHFRLKSMQNFNHVSYKMKKYSVLKITQKRPVF
jgi:hypothetical protein